MDVIKSTASNEGMLLTLEGIEFGKVEQCILDGYNEILPERF
jgi:hypothetical protein